MSLNSNGTNVRCCAGTFCREFTGHIYWHAAFHSCSLLPRIVKDSSFECLSLATCICFGGEVLYCELYRVRKPELPHRSVASLCGKNYACNRHQECAIRKPTQRVQHAARSTQQGVLSQSSAGDKGPPLQAYTTFGFGAFGGDLRGAATFCMGRTP